MQFSLQNYYNLSQSISSLRLEGLSLNARLTHARVMTEEAAEEEAVDEGLVFHEGMRLTEMKTKQNISVEYPKLKPLHHIKVELLFHYYKIRSTWSASHWITLAIGCLAVLLSSWDFGIGELSGGGGVEGFFAVGVNPNDAGSGIRTVATASVVLSIVSLPVLICDRCGKINRSSSTCPVIRQLANSYGVYTNKRISALLFVLLIKKVQCNC